MMESIKIKHLLTHLEGQIDYQFYVESVESVEKRKGIENQSLNL